MVVPLDLSFSFQYNNGNSLEPESKGLQQGNERADETDAGMRRKNYGKIIGSDYGRGVFGL